jgi:glycosyltransferase involved in cell wall biosynthesis
VTFLERLHAFCPDVIHVHHAFKSRALLLDSRVQAETALLPLIVSPGGTDINLDFGMADRRETILRVLRMSRIIVAQGAETARSLRQLMPDLLDRIIDVPKAAAWFGDEPYDLRGMTGCSPEDVLFFLPAGIRPVKRNLECLAAAAKVHAIRPGIRFAAAGPAVDSEYAARFESEVKRSSIFSSWIRAIPPAAMRAAYNASDVVLNASFSEGLSNALLEAVVAGRPILASDIPGNRQTVLGEEGNLPAGLLFNPNDADDFVRKAVMLIDETALRRRLGEAARLRKACITRPEEEAKGLMAAYEGAIAKSRSSNGKKALPMLPMPGAPALPVAHCAKMARSPDRFQSRESTKKERQP